MSTTEAEIEHLRADIQRLRADIEQLGTTLGRVARAGAREAGESVCGATGGFRTDLRHTVDRVTSSIEENPIAAAVAALGVGMLLGRIFSCRRG
jgi:ElaB/YqjD/DUF883 family membrane-anchored ribosome-binding protein